MTRDAETRGRHHIENDDYGQNKNVSAVAMMLAATLENISRAGASTNRVMPSDVIVAGWIEAIMASRILRDQLTRLEPFIITQVESRMVDGSPGGIHLSSRENCLSAREHSILVLMGRGMSNKQIARDLLIAPETVKTYVKRIFVKLSAQTRAEAVCRAAALGIL